MNRVCGPETIVAFECSQTRGLEVVRQEGLHVSPTTHVPCKYLSHSLRDCDFIIEGSTDLWQEFLMNEKGPRWYRCVDVQGAAGGKECGEGHKGQLAQEGERGLLFRLPSIYGSIPH